MRIGNPLPGLPARLLLEAFGVAEAGHHDGYIVRRAGLLGRADQPGAGFLGTSVLLENAGEGLDRVLACVSRRELLAGGVRLQPGEGVVPQPRGGPPLQLGRLGREGVPVGVVAPLPVADELLPRADRLAPA